MKLKTKLIATIVSICAAIAVMGVGVWAAVSDFTVSVTTTASVAFHNIAGKVTYSGTATQVGGTHAGLTDAETVIFDSEDASKLAGSYEITATDFDVPKALNKDGENASATAVIIENNTTSATITYTFVYTPYGDVGWVHVSVSETSAVTAEGATVSTAYTINGETADATNATAQPFAANTTITVVCTLTYSNASCLSATLSGDWSFAVTFAAAATSALA